MVIFNGNNKKSASVETLDNYTYTHTALITSSTYLPSRDFVAITDIDKKFHLIDRKTSQVLVTKLVVLNFQHITLKWPLFHQNLIHREISKRAAKMIYTKDESTILLADKTGDLYTLDFNGQNLESGSFKLLMGHLSMLTDLVNYCVSS